MADWSIFHRTDITTHAERDRESAGYRLSGGARYRYFLEFFAKNDRLWSKYDTEHSGR